jgi:hypothetical protein
MAMRLVVVIEPEPVNRGRVNFLRIGVMNKFFTTYRILQRIQQRHVCPRAIMVI